MLFRSHDAVILQPDQQLIYDTRNDSFIVKSFNKQSLLSWKSGVYIFDKMPLSEIVEILGKGFGVHISIINEDLKQKPFTAKFENGESLEMIMELIKINAKYTYYYNNGILTIN